MGDVCDHNDLERFLRSPEGQEHLEGFRRTLIDRSIVDVEFSNEIHAIVLTLHLDNGESFALCQASLEVDAIRKEFSEVLEREFKEDYPDPTSNDSPS
ncbi:MAG: hypothetical protein AMXMBFR82_07020 [Candidatus Hydrogenedentota bacterium]